MNAYQIGLKEGKEMFRKDRVRRYESQKAERDYWRGYIDGIISVNPGKSIVQCEREGMIFPVVLVNAEHIDCPTCGRRYVKEGEHYESDRRLTILHAVAN